MKYKKLLLVFVALLVASLAFAGIACCALPILVEGSLDISPEEVGIGGTVTISIDVQNMGMVEGEATVTLKINGEEVESKSVTLAASDIETVEFTYVAEAAGEYTIEVNGQTGTLTVTEEVVTPTPTPTATPTGTPVVGAAPTLYVGDTWVYYVTYPEEEDSTMTTVVVADDIEYKGTPCYEVEITFEPSVKRTAAAVPLTVTMKGLTEKRNKETNDSLWRKPDMTPMAVTMMYSYHDPYPAGRWPMDVGGEMTYTLSASPALAPPEDYRVVVEAIEDVTVTIDGTETTFSCYYIVEYKDGDIAFENWYSDEVKSFVKMVDHDTYVETETRVLTSYTITP